MVFRGLDDDKAALVVEQALVQKDPAPLKPAPLSLPQVWVCAHVRRDARCGHCGPRLKALFMSALGGGAQVRGCSHVGGHVYAGNVILSAGPTLEWYGYVAPSDVDSLVARLQGGPCPEKILRGRMG